LGRPNEARALPLAEAVLAAVAIRAADGLVLDSAGEAFFSRLANLAEAVNVERR
jgi:hypothetical protein